MTTLMRMFTMYRRGDISATHNEDTMNPPDEPQYEGVVFSDGSVAIRWRTAKRSTSVWASMEDMMAVHGHPEYDSELVWETPDPAQVPPINMDIRVSGSQKLTPAFAEELRKAIESYVQRKARTW
jgi:hypothetical protein